MRYTCACLLLATIEALNRLGSSNCFSIFPMVSPMRLRAACAAMLNSVCKLLMLKSSCFSREDSRLPMAAVTCGHGRVGGAYDKKLLSHTRPCKHHGFTPSSTQYSACCRHRLRVVRACNKDSKASRKDNLHVHHCKLATIEE